MQRDILEGRPSELAGVEAPVHATLYATLLPGELRARGQLRED
jgi:hypothetical protein